MTIQKLSRLDIESLPNYRKKTNKEWSSACPECQGVDRFLFWPDAGNYLCRKCGCKGFVLEVDQKFLTNEQREAWKRAADERKRKEAEERLSAIERLQKIANRVEIYHSQVGRALDYWHSQGLNDSTISEYRLGFCPACPTDPNSPSFTIPYFCQTRLINLRHRLQFPNGHGKYRPEFAGLGNQLFNADTLKVDEVHFGLLEADKVIIVEGEIKTMVLEQIGFKTIGIPGANSWRPEWSENLKGFKAYICLDPGANGQADRIGETLKGYNIPAKVVTLPCKPDDMFIKFGATINDFLGFLKQGKRING